MFKKTPKPDSAAATEKPESSAGSASQSSKLNQLWHWATTHKKLSIPIAIVTVLALLMIIPFTRYAILGLFMKQDLKVIVVDSETNKPVSSASVSLEGVSALTDSKGLATLHVKVGPGQLAVEKTYYKTLHQDVTVTVTKPDPLTVKIVSTGRPVPVVVTNTLTGEPVKNAVLSAENTEAKTDAKGQATMVLPPEKTKVEGTITATGFNSTTVTITVTANVDPANSFSITPAGKLYFLSNAAGKIDVAKTNLDGTERQTVLAGTGKEDKQHTVLLASTDWKYLALLSKRDGGDNPKLFLLDTSTDKLTVMDEGDATFTISGWDGHNFIYTVTRNATENWQSKQQALKAFNADRQKITTLDETTATGSSQHDYLKETIGDAYVLDGTVVYSKGWEGGMNTWAMALPAKQATLNSVKPDGSSKKVVKSFALAPGTQASSMTLFARPYNVDELYLLWNEGTKDIFYEYADGQVKEDKNLTAEQFYTAYPTYLISPAGDKTFWSEQRDGKNSLFIGDSEGENGKQVAKLVEYQTYGWYTNDYVLVSKQGSELYIFSAQGMTGDQKPYKITDYYKPAITFYGYGGGYGGL